MPQTNTDKPLVESICKRLDEFVMSDRLSNDGLVQIIEHVGGYLNLCTRSAYAKAWGKSYNAAKKFRKNVKLFGATFVIDND
jgi:hypothetical protein